jgi:cytochrome bd ubiquinol oxidase subunit I
LDATWLARVQFALTIMFHFLFPPITMGLAFLIAIIETKRWRGGSDVYRRASDFWLKILAVNFVVGVASVIVMEFQLGTNWAGYSRFVWDIFGAPSRPRASSRSSWSRDSSARSSSAGSAALPS